MVIIYARSLISYMISTQYLWYNVLYCAFRYFKICNLFIVKRNTWFFFYWMQWNESLFCIVNFNHHRFFFKANIIVYFLQIMKDRAHAKRLVYDFRTSIRLVHKFVPFLFRMEDMTHCGSFVKLVPNNDQTKNVQVRLCY